jgi:EthD domain
LNLIQRDAAYKVALLLSRDPAVDASDFAGLWLSATAPAKPQGLRERTFNSVITADLAIENASSALFDAVDEFIFSDAQHAAKWIGSADFRDGWLGTRLPLLAGPVHSVSGHVVEVWNSGRPASASSVKILTLPVRRPGLDMSAFTKHWLVVHAGLALEGPNIREHLQRLVSTPADQQRFPPLELAPFDGIGVIEFDSAESLAAEFASDHYRRVMAPDEPRFTDPAASRAIMVRELDTPASVRV